MKIMRILLLILVACSQPACASSMQGSVMEKKPVIARFPAEWTEKIHFAQQDFLSTGQSLDCFELVMGWDEQDQYYYIAFFPERGPDEQDVIGTTSCGKGVSYQFDSDGNFLKRVFQR